MAAEEKPVLAYTIIGTVAQCVVYELSLWESCHQGITWALPQLTAGAGWQDEQVEAAQW